MKREGILRKGRLMEYYKKRREPESERQQRAAISSAFD